MKKIVFSIIVIIVLSLNFIFIRSIVIDFETPEINKDQQQEMITFLDSLKEQKINNFKSIGIELEDWQTKYYFFIGDPKDGYYAEVSPKQESTILFGPNNIKIPRSFTWQESILGRNNQSGLPAEYNNILYFVNSGCIDSELIFNCTADQYLEYSNNEGQTWEKSDVELPQRIKQSYFVNHDNKLYHIYSNFCDSGIDFFPAIGAGCGEVHIRSLDEDNNWTEPKIITLSADSLLGAYDDDSGIKLVWSDTRYDIANWCGYLPGLGCFDGEPTRGPYVLYLGEYNVSSGVLNEFVIQNELYSDLRLY